MRVSVEAGLLCRWTTPSRLALKLINMAGRWANYHMPQRRWHLGRLGTAIGVDTRGRTEVSDLLMCQMPYHPPVDQGQLYTYKGAENDMHIHT